MIIVVNAIRLDFNTDVRYPSLKFNFQISRIHGDVIIVEMWFLASSWFSLLR